MDGSNFIKGIFVLDIYAPMTDCSTVRILISLVIGNKWDIFHWDISFVFTPRYELRVRVHMVNDLLLWLEVYS